VLGVAVLAAVFAKTGGYTSGQAFVDGLIPAVWVGAVAVAGAVVAAVLIARRSRVVSDVTALPGQAVREPVAA
jgi:hypothetical protein